MKTKLFTIFLSFVMVVGFLATTSDLALAAKDTQATSSVEKVKKNKDGETDGGTVSTEYIAGNFWGKLLDRALGGIVDKVITESWSVFSNFMNKSNKNGGDDGLCSEVKIMGHRFNHKDTANWVGDGRTNSYTRVRDIQNYLIEAGYNPGAVDGYWGSNTKYAVKRMQADEGLYADGVVGTKTWAHLGGGDRCD